MDTWVEKYRPTSLLDIIGQDCIVNTLQHYVQTDNVPNIIFYGKKGVGKTSTIHALCRDLYGMDYKKYVLELNASHERGIHTIRTKVKTMAQSKTNKIKMIILDEADSMTKDAMFALRMIMENYSHITRFCLICNYINKIIEPLRSRCTVFYFQPINNDDIQRALGNISDNTNEQIIKYVNGDMRKAILLLQYANHDIQGLCGISEELCDQLFKHLKYHSFNQVLEVCFEIDKGAYQIGKMIHLLAEKILKDESIKHKHEILYLIGEKDVEINRGMWDYMELVELCSKIDSLIKIK